ncbi:MAG: tetratricopeptide repeat protein [candidate division KSB1 bacterium]|nr:tetratricopeptide repeat protein [candidate division KSB1 bacterium]MDZ7273060.1 tetratricopeptide repeat protein [candidate division KSB1 bacterium]MDZ7285163.1 tetratricopeptide repeat protein [candidate division KSB1 bacterium]MDZ7298195.1 tetratricopeptide repeat protein [candidate division KSB1 bacterium]MDZ7306869.1 tetratricopeptide repeat protein [candidate division KSB1 bacterium]
MIANHSTPNISPRPRLPRLCRAGRPARDLALLAPLLAALLLSPPALAQLTRDTARPAAAGAAGVAAHTRENPDSTLRSYTIDELLAYKDFYERQRLRTDRERVWLREKGIRDMETFLNSHPKSKVQDKVIVRLAELHYEKSLESYAQAQENYSRQLARLDSGLVTTPPVEPKKDYSASLALYRRILAEHPDSPLRDDAAYNIAFLTEDLGARQQAVALYQEFIQNYPNSRYIPDALFRVAEYYFNPPKNNLDSAIAIYQQVLRYGDSPKYDEALYRLGWAHYKRNEYPQAISYFTLLADDLHRARRLDPKNQITNPSLLEESIEYIGISFLDYQGPDKAAQYLADLGGREYGLDILMRIGDIYMNVKEEHENAIRAYHLLLRMYPNAPAAPLVRAKIAEAYRALDDEQMAYLQRDSLFLDYREGTTWWLHNSDEEVRRQGRALAERALRENINLLLKRADEYGDNNLYAQAVNDSRKYLVAFPKDTMAALIHWNLALTLDAKLKQAPEAFTEYLEISNRYWNSRFQKLAAENSVALAQEMASADTMRRPQILPLKLGDMKAAVETNRDSLRQALKLDPIPMSVGEQNLARALDNYIRLFPHEPATAERLAQAGALYYNKNEFAGALKYFKTLLKHFPQSPDAPYAEYLVMESYFGKLDYKSCEIVARRIKQTSPNREYALKAEKRLAESIFLQAEDLAHIAEHVRAGEEYRRVYEEVPTAEFADLALYNAGLEFDQAREYRRAVETYALLTDNFPKSPHYLSGLNNMAYDYGELNDYLNAALTFERLANEEPDSSKAETSLFNASVYFVRAEDWPRAIRVNRKFVDKYPASKDADDLFYDIANYHLKLDQLEEANAVYGEYAQRFPDSPRVVETFYRRGEYFEWKGLLAQARAEYEKAMARSNDFRRRSMDHNDFFSAEALFRLTELKFRDFAEVRFKLPKAQLDAAKERKKNALIDIVDGYTRVAGFGTLRLYEATYKIGAAYEEFAQTWADQEIPEVDENRRIVAKKEINQASAELYERALQSYRHAALALERLAAQYNPPADTTVRHARLAREDSTTQVARRWIQRSKDKVSEVIYDIAELNNASMKQLLDAPTPGNMDKITALEFRNQLLGKFVKPLVAQTIQAHQRNLRECDSLGIESAWLDLSRRKIVEINNALAREYASLARRALSQYAADIGSYKRLVDAADFQADDVKEEMSNLVDFGRSFAEAAVQAYLETLNSARQAKVRPRALEDTEEQLLHFVFTHARQCDSLASAANSERLAFEDRLRREGRQDLQDAVFTFEDNFFALTEGKKKILEAGFLAMRDHGIENPWSEKITLMLVRSDPVKYARELELTIADTTVFSDGGWQASTQYIRGWTAPEFNAAGWSTAQALGASAVFAGYGAQRLWLAGSAPAASSPDSAGGTPARLVSNSTAGSGVNLGYFRKSFAIRGLPVSGQIQVHADDSYNVFVNGEYLAQVIGAAGEAGKTHIHDCSSFLRSGVNVVAFEVRDTDHSGGGLEAVIFLKSLPGWEKHQSEVQLKKERHEEMLIFERGFLPNLR